MVHRNVTLLMKSKCSVFTQPSFVYLYHYLFASLNGEDPNLAISLVLVFPAGWHSI